MSMTPETQLLSQRNQEHVFRICFQFLKDKYHLDLPEGQVRMILSQCMNDMVEMYKQNPPFPPVDEFNKRTIVRAKEQIMLLLREITMPPPPPRPTPPPAAPPKMQTVPPSHPMSPPALPVREDNVGDDAIEESGEDTFLKKLQNLELQRNASIVTAASQPRPVEPAGDAMVLAPKPVAPPPPSGTTVLYLPTPTDGGVRMGKSFVVHSGNRLWSYFHERALLSWEGPMPGSESYMHCTSLLISRSAQIISPIIRIAIEGPGGHNAETLCTFAQKGHKWDVWQPASSTIGTMRTVPTPWTIRLYDITNRLLDLGKDGYTIREATALINQNTKWVFHESIPMLTRGMTLLCRHADGTVRRHTALHVHDASVEVEGRHTEVEGCVCAVEDLQVTLVFEMIKNETAPPVVGGVAHGNPPVSVSTVGSGVVRGAIETPAKGGK
jgi:hypothetical protein